jgi:protein involved in polysaccharide export with SLBB domain
MRRSRWTVLVLSFLSSLATAQVPTPAQLEMLKSLSPADREALMQQYGITGDAAASVEASAARTPEAAAPKSRAEREEDLERATKALTLQPEDTVILAVTRKPADPENPQTDSQTQQQARFIESVRRRNPFTLDGAGLLQLPGLEPIALAGLTDAQANARLAAEPELSGFTVQLSRLPVVKTGTAGLKPFGYDLFDEAPSTFAPMTDIPVPADYVVGAGDQLNVQLFGSQNRTLKLTVGRDGRVNFPELGPIAVAGKSFDAVRGEIEARVAQQMIGTQASVGLADTRSIRVFVLGEAQKPGSYTVSGLATVTSALYASGGIKSTGSLRDVQLKRQGALVRRFDLYDLLLRGDTSNDAKLQAGDVIFIPPVGATVSVEGEVRRPAIYELKGSVSLGAAVALAGGLTNEADDSRVAVLRVGEDKRRVALNLPLNTAEGRSAALRNGDAVRVQRLRPTLDAGVSLEGHVFRAGTVAWREGLRLSELIPSVDELKPDADLNYVLIRRELPPDRRLAVLSADLAAALRSPGSTADVPLAARDRVIVFDMEAGRRQVLNPLLAELRRQGGVETPSAVVSIGGRVKAPGEYPLEPGMRVSDLLRAGGNLEDSAYGVKAELSRFVSGRDERKSELIEIDLAAVRRGEAAADITLQAFDALIIKELPEWAKQESVTVSGEVRFPGTYPIRRGETLRSVIERAGGLTGLAFVKGSVFTRRELRERETEQINRLTERLQSDLAATAIQAGQIAQGQQAAQGAMNAQALLGQLKTSKPIGRLVIDLDRVLAGNVGSPSDVLLRDGDQLIIPKIRQEVTVLGEVQNGTSHLYRAGLSRDDYVNLSGGLTRKADKSRIYVVKADGSVVAKTGWLGDGKTAIQPGDTIVAPLDTERLPPLPFWQAVTSIIYNAAVAVAAIGSL